MSFIPYGKQNITQEDIEAVVDVLRSDFLTQGPKVPQFEKAIAELTNADFALAVNSATSALHLACLALGVEESDIVWTTPITFVASANCALYCGAQVDFVDINPKTYNMSVSALTEKLELAASTGKLPKVVIPVHLCGQPCEMQQIYELSKQYGFFIIEDASHAIGGKYQKEPIGNCRYSDLTVFSFHPVKIITTAEGGVVTTNNPKLASKIDLLRSHGITRDPELMTSEPDGAWYYQQIDLGFNYRMTELQAALGLSQTYRLKEIIKKRHHNAQLYDQKLSALPVITPYSIDDSYSGMHLYVIRVDSSKTAKKRIDIYNYLREAKIGVNVHYIPVHTQPYYKELGFKEKDFPNAEHYYDTAISLPMFPELSEEQINYVVLKLSEALECHQ